MIPPAVYLAAVVLVVLLVIFIVRRHRHSGGSGSGPQCSSASDCGPHAACVGGKCVSTLCPTTPCPSGKYCDPDGACYACVLNSQCPSGELCANHACIQSPSCQGDSDCPSGQECIQGECVPPASCHKDTDCPVGKQCVVGQCVAGCESADNCPPGDVCISGMCASAGTCKTSSDCPSGQVCKNGKCAQAPPPSCAPSTGCPCFALEQPGATCYGADSAGNCWECDTYVDSSSDPCKRACTQLSTNRQNSALPCKVDVATGNYKCLYPQKGSFTSRW